jgi:hypothetical protein
MFIVNVGTHTAAAKWPASFEFVETDVSGHVPVWGLVPRVQWAGCVPVTARLLSGIAEYFTVYVTVSNKNENVFAFERLF